MLSNQPLQQTQLSIIEASQMQLELYMTQMQYLDQQKDKEERQQK
jgi:hypothetical protein